MKTPATVLVHACKLCQAIWEGPVAPPVTCPGCGGNAGWSSGEVRPQPGMVGGRIFVPGTDRPRTRVYICGGCSKTHVDRNGAEAPVACPHCGARDVFMEAMTATKAAPAFTQTQTGSSGSSSGAPIAIGRVDAALQRLIEEDRKTEYIAPEQPQSPADAQHASDTAIVSADEYRREWVADRVANWFDAGMPGVAGIADLTTDTIWDWVAGTYDSGRKRGLLP